MKSRKITCTLTYKYDGETHTHEGITLVEARRIRASLPPSCGAEISGIKFPPVLWNNKKKR